MRCQLAVDRLAGGQRHRAQKLVHGVAVRGFRRRQASEDLAADPDLLEPLADRPEMRPHEEIRGPHPLARRQHLLQLLATRGRVAGRRQDALQSRQAFGQLRRHLAGKPPVTTRGRRVLRQLLEEQPHVVTLGQALKNLLLERLAPCRLGPPTGDRRAEDQPDGDDERTCAPVGGPHYPLLPLAAHAIIPSNQRQSH